MKPGFDCLAAAATGVGRSAQGAPRSYRAWCDEFRLLELVGAGYKRQVATFYHRGLRRTRVFGEFELGYLLDGLAHGPMPALTGLDETRTISRENLRDRVMAYQRCRFSITDFGRAVLRPEEDFSRHNPIDRWWGGTHLTNDNMWRWQPTLIEP